MSVSMGVPSGKLKSDQLPIGGCQVDVPAPATKGVAGVLCHWHRQDIGGRQRRRSPDASQSHSACAGCVPQVAGQQFHSGPVSVHRRSAVP